MMMAGGDGWRRHKVGQVTSKYVNDSQRLFDDVEKKDKRAAVETTPTLSNPLKQNQLYICISYINYIQNYMYYILYTIYKLNQILHNTYI